MHAQTQQAANWWARPRGQTNQEWVANYQKSLKVRHRDLIVETVQSLGDVTSVLEVGSHCGPNLVRLAMDCPHLTQLTGLDVNGDAISAGIRWVDGLRLSERVHLEVGRMPEATSGLPDGCVDVVLSCYALAYIAPQDLDAMLYEMGRLSRRAVILAEPMTDGVKAEGGATFGGYAEWAHNYQAALKWIGTLRGRATRRIDVTPPVDRLNAILVADRGASTTP